jgi:NAD-dependent deacetylase
MRKIVALTGAGISRASGLPTYEDDPVLVKLFTNGTFWHEPEWAWKKFMEVAEKAAHALPNDAHMALAEFNIPIITQNVDGLHWAAGSDALNVIELHGNLHQVRCDCGTISTPKVKDTPVCPDCGRQYIPDIVFRGDDVYRGDQPRHWDEAEKLIDGSQVLLVIGCSLQTYPAANLVELAEWKGLEIITVNNNAEGRVREILEIITSC